MFYININFIVPICRFYIQYAIVADIFSIFDTITVSLLQQHCHFKTCKRLRLFFRPSPHFIHTVCISRCSVRVLRMRIYIPTTIAISVYNIQYKTHIGYLNLKVFERYFHSIRQLSICSIGAALFFYIRISFHYNIILHYYLTD